MDPTKNTARIAGLLYLAIIAAGIFAEFFVRQSIIMPGDAVTTAQNVLAAEGLFRWGIAGDLLMIICDVALALVFYHMFKAVNQALALLAAFFRLTQAAILGLNLLNLFFVLELLSGATFLNVFDTTQVQALALFFFEAHGIGYTLALIFFGMNCVIFGYLVYQSGYLPRILGALIIFAGAGYLSDGFASFLLPSYALYQPIFDMGVFLPAFSGELALCLWLLIKGIKVEKAELRPSPAF